MERDNPFSFPRLPLFVSPFSPFSPAFCTLLSFLNPNAVSLLDRLLFCYPAVGLVVQTNCSRIWLEVETTRSWWYQSTSFVLHEIWSWLLGSNVPKRKHFCFWKNCSKSSSLSIWWLSFSAPFVISKLFIQDTIMAVQKKSDTIESIRFVFIGMTCKLFSWQKAVKVKLKMENLCPCIQILNIKWCQYFTNVFFFKQKFTTNQNHQILP